MAAFLFCARFIEAGSAVMEAARGSSIGVCKIDPELRHAVQYLPTNLRSGHGV